jgi:hypothetical protein
MADRLITIARFDQPAKARLAQNALDAAGIKAAVADETTIGMDWLLGAAVGWVKVQVIEENAERAVAVLEEQFGERGEGFGERVTPEELEAQAAGAAAEDEQPEPDLQTQTTRQEPPDTSDPYDPYGREAYARRVAFTGILILVFVPFWFWYPLISFAFFPLAFYALYLTLNAVFGPGELTNRGRLNIAVGVGAIALTLSWFYFFALLVLW